MERREKERAATGRRGEGYGRRKKKARASQPSRSRREEQDSPAHTHEHSHTHSDCTQYNKQHAAASTLPSCQTKGREGKGKEGEEGDPLARALDADWTRIGCLAGKGRLLSVLTDPAALVPERGGTVDQSHALACRSTAHLVCNPHALPPWAPASLPTLPPTCSLMPSFRLSDGAIN